MATIPETLVPVESGIDKSQVAVVIPTINAGRMWDSFNDGLRMQGLHPGQVLIVDSSSDDETRELAEAEGYRVHRIQRSEFNHGGTRKLALYLVPWARIVVYLTQDAFLASPDALDQLLSAFEDSRVAAAYGRQLPRPGAGPIEAHARLFNYPAEGDVRDFESRHRLGIKAAFLSNSFAAYRRNELLEVGGFPEDVIMAEDAIVAGKLLLAGWKTAYVPEAQVYHSHPFTLAEEFRRYFDIGVCHRREAWLPERFGRPGREGKRYVRSEFAYIWRRGAHLLPLALLRTLSKALGYQLGLHGSWLDKRWSRVLSYHKSFWDAAAPMSTSSRLSRCASSVSTSGQAPL